MARGDGIIYLRGTTFWCCYYLRGKQFREPARDKNGRTTTDPKTAQKYLQDKIKEKHADEIGAAPFTTPQARRVTIHDLLERLKAQFELNGQASPQNLSHLRRADGDLGTHLAVGLKSQIIEDYKKNRLAAGDKPASINRPLQLIRQAYLLAVHSETLARAPYIKLLSEKGNARKGFCEESEFRKIHEFLPAYLQDLCLFAYCTGMRFGEVLSLKWEYVKGDVIELQAEDAKGDGDEQNARLIPMVGKDLAGILERRKVARRVKTDQGTTLAALIFHHDGHAIVDIRKAWKSACKKGGVPGRLFHDLRRSFVKNADEAGVSRDVAMSLSGHRSQATYTRYNISDVKRKRKALELVQEFREAQAAQAAQESNVVAMR